VSGADLEEAFSATIIYLVVYALMNLGAFAAVIAGARTTQSGELSAWAGLGRVDARIGVMIGIFFFSLAGIPPLAGWFAKFVMFRSVILAGGTATVVLAIIAAINAVISLYYYAKVVRSVWMDEATKDLQVSAPAGSLRLALGVSVALTVLIGIYPAAVTFVTEASKVLATGG